MKGGGRREEEGGRGRSEEEEGGRRIEGMPTISEPGGRDRQGQAEGVGSFGGTIFYSANPPYPPPGVSRSKSLQATEPVRTKEPVQLALGGAPAAGVAQHQAPAAEGPPAATSTKKLRLCRRRQKMALHNAKTGLPG